MTKRFKFNNIVEPSSPDMDKRVLREENHVDHEDDEDGEILNDINGANPSSAHGRDHIHIPHEQPTKVTTMSSKNWSHKEILKTHKYLKESYPTMPGLGTLQKIAFHKNHPIEHLKAFRTAPNEWRIYIKKGSKGGYVAHPMLPKATLLKESDVRRIGRAEIKRLNKVRKMSKLQLRLATIAGTQKLSKNSPTEAHFHRRMREYYKGVAKELHKTTKFASTPEGAKAYPGLAKMRKQLPLVKKYIAHHNGLYKAAMKKG